MAVWAADRRLLRATSAGSTGTRFLLAVCAETGGTAATAANNVHQASGFRQSLMRAHAFEGVRSAPFVFSVPERIERCSPLRASSTGARNFPVSDCEFRT